MIAIISLFFAAGLILLENKEKVFDAFDWLFIFAGILRTISYLPQPLEIWRNESIGDIDIRVPIVTMLGGFVWLGYSFLLEEITWGLRAYLIVYLLTVGSTFVLCLIYPEKKEAKALKA